MCTGTDRSIITDHIVTKLRPFADHTIEQFDTGSDLYIFTDDVKTEEIHTLDHRAFFDDRILYRQAARLNADSRSERIEMCFVIFAKITDVAPIARRDIAIESG